MHDRLNRIPYTSRTPLARQQLTPCANAFSRVLTRVHPHLPARSGLAPALVQGPLSRFGDTAANAGALAFLEAYEPTANLPVSSHLATC